MDRNTPVSAREKERRFAFSFSRVCLAVLFALGSSCTFFHSQPPLPKHAAIETRITPDSEEKFALLIQNADIIYFPTELLESASRSEPAWKLVEALRRQGGSFAIGADLIGGDAQALLDDWGKQQSSTDDLISRLQLSGASRESCRALLGEMGKKAARVLALGCPPELLASPANSPGREEIARKFQPSPGDFRAFADHFAPMREMSDDKARETYEAALLEEEYAAHRIVGQFREHGDEKLLIFVHRHHLGSVRGVAYLVAQKLKARQLVLETRPHAPSRSQLLTFTRRANLGGTRRLEIVDSAPGPARDQL